METGCYKWASSARSKLNGAYKVQVQPKKRSIVCVGRWKFTGARSSRYLRNMLHRKILTVWKKKVFDPLEHFIWKICTSWRELPLIKKNIHGSEKSLKICIRLKQIGSRVTICLGSIFEPPRIALIPKIVQHRISKIRNLLPTVPDPMKVWGNAHHNSQPTEFYVITFFTSGNSLSGWLLKKFQHELRAWRTSKNCELWNPVAWKYFSWNEQILQFEGISSALLTNIDGQTPTLTN